MGVPKFFGAYIKKHFSPTSGVLLTKIPDDTPISSFFVDMNSVIHEVARAAFEDSYDEAKFFQMLSTKLLEYIVLVNPQDLLGLFVDGSANFGKIMQQRSRRYKGTLNATGKFISAAISPGTDFMVRLDEYLRKWIENDLSKAFKFKTLLSSHTQNHEAEHRFSAYIRDHVDVDSRVVISALDADIIILGLISPVKHIYLFRQNLEIISCYRLREEIIKDMGIQNRPESIVDFIIMSIFIGSDFVPTQVSAEDLGLVLVNMISKYQKLNIPLIDKNYNIIWPNFGRFLKSVSNSEEYYLSRESRREKKFGYELMDKSVINGEFSYETFRSVFYRQELENPFRQEVTPQAIFEMCENYFDVIQWIVHYYTKGADYVDSYLIYRYTKAPLFKDLVSSLFRYQKLPKKKIDTTPINAVVQLICIIPPQYFSVLPSELLDFLKRTVCLNDMFPYKFEVDLDGKNNDHSSVAKLPIPDIKRVIACVSNSGCLQGLMDRMNGEDFIVESKL